MLRAIVKCGAGAAFVVHLCWILGQCRLVDHCYNGHRHVCPHHIRVRHAEEQHERDHVAQPQPGCNKKHTNLNDIIKITT